MKRVLAGDHAAQVEKEILWWAKPEFGLDFEAQAVAAGVVEGSLFAPDGYVVAHSELVVSQLDAQLGERAASVGLAVSDDPALRVALPV
jgi:hypothetical protein